MTTTTTTTDPERKHRLFGSATSESGGGLPLPIVWSRLLEHVVDTGHLAPDQAMALAATSLKLKVARVKYVYKHLDGDAWHLLAADLTAQLVEAELLQPDFQGWVAGPKLAIGQSLTIAPGHHVLVHNATDREVFNQAASRRGNLNALVASLRQGEIGLRKVDMKVVGELVQSMQAFGFLPGQEIKIARGGGLDGAILGGRHRIAAVSVWRTWPTDYTLWPAEGKKYLRYVDLPSEDTDIALATAIYDNKVAGWSKSVLMALGRSFRDDGAPLDDATLATLGRDGKREEIRLALLRDPSLSDRAIGSQVGAWHETVGNVRAELIANGDVPWTVANDSGDDVGDQPKKRGRKSDTEAKVAKAKAKQEAKAAAAQRLFERGMLVVTLWESTHDWQAVCADMDIQDPRENGKPWTQQSAKRLFEGYYKSLGQPIPDYSMNGHKRKYDRANPEAGVTTLADADEQAEDVTDNDYTSDTESVYTNGHTHQDDAGMPQCTGMCPVHCGG